MKHLFIRFTAAFLYAVLSCILAANVTYAQNTPLSGKVVAQGESNTPLANVQITAQGANNEVSKTNGSFALQYAQKKAGDDAALWAEKKDYLIINEAELRSQLIPNDPKEEVWIVMCEQQTFAQNKARHYKLSEEMSVKSYQNILQSLEQQYAQKLLTLEQLEDKKAQAEDDFQRAMKNLDETAERYARVHLGRADEALKAAMRHFEQGNLDQAIAAIDDNKLSLRSSEIKEETKRLQNTGDELADRRRNLAQKKQQYFDVLWLKADLYKLRYEWEKVEQCYVWGVELDSLNLENVFRYAHYLHNQGSFEKANNYYILALRLCKNNAETATVFNNLAILQHEQGEFSLAEGNLGQVLNMYNSLDELQPGQYSLEIGITLTNLGNVQKDLRNFDLAKKYYNQALGIYEQVYSKNPSIYAYDIALTLNDLANLHYSVDEISEAHDAFEKVLNTRICLANQNPQMHNPHLANTYNNIAILQRREDNIAAAKDSHKKAIDIRRELVNYNQYAYSSDLAISLNNLGTLQMYVNEIDEAIESYEEAFAIYEKLTVSNPQKYFSDFVMICENKGDAHLHKSELDTAEHYYQKAYDTANKLSKFNYDIYKPNVASTLCRIGYVQQMKKNTLQAEYNYKQAIAIYKQLFNENKQMFSQAFAASLDELASVQTINNNFLDAENNYKIALKIRQSQGQNLQDTAAMVITLNGLGFLYYAQSKYDSSQEKFEEALKVCQQLVKINPQQYDLQLCNTLVSLLNLYYQKYSSTKNVEIRKKSLALLTDAEQRLQNYPDHPTAQQYMEVIKEYQSLFSK